jgi:biopolymer transport protein ExbD
VNDAATDATHEVNLTPLIDVSLVLVVMLLLMTPLALESSFAVKSAAPSGRTEAADDVERVELRILDEDHVRVNRDTVTRAELAGALLPLLGGESASTVVVTCEPLVSHGTFVNVLDITKAAGADEIALAGR